MLLSNKLSALALVLAIALLYLALFADEGEGYFAVRRSWWGPYGGYHRTVVRGWGR
jgi:hypothetical protein